MQSWSQWSLWAVIFFKYLCTNSLATDLVTACAEAEIRQDTSLIPLCETLMAVDEGSSDTGRELLPRARTLYLRSTWKKDLSGIAPALAITIHESLAPDNSVRSKRFLRFGRALSGDRFLRFGRSISPALFEDKRFLRFGRSTQSLEELLREALDHMQTLEQMEGQKIRRKRSTDVDPSADANRLKEEKALETESEKSKRFMRFGKKDEGAGIAKRNADDQEEFVENKRFMRFGRGDEKRFMRFGRDNADGRQVGDWDDKRFMRFGRNPDEKRFMRFGRGLENEDEMEDEKRFMRFGRGNADAEEKRFMRFGRGNADAEEKRFMRFGRDSPAKRFMRFGRNPERRFMRFGRDPKDENNSDMEKRFMRFGRADATYSLPEEEKRFMRFGRATLS